MDLINQFADLILAAWNTFVDGIAGIGPWLQSTFAVADWIQAITDWISAFPFI